jgi:DUF1365 family protein
VTALPIERPTDETRRAPRPAPAELYEGTVAHTRHGPDPRRFTPRLFLAHLDLDALPGALDPFPGWSARRRAPLHFRRQDFLDGGTAPLGDAVRDLVADRLGRRPTGPVTLLAHLRTFGWLFNPLSVYYCWSTAGDALDAIVLEVSNTPWGERTWYVLDARNDEHGADVAKQLHVSPFLPMDVRYRISWTTPADDLHLRIDVERDGTTVFDAALALHRVPLDDRSAVAMPARYWLLPLRVSAGIHREALRLFLRRTPVYRHPATPRAPS